MNELVITEPIIIVPASSAALPGDAILAFLDSIDPGALDQAVLDLDSGFGTSPMTDVVRVLKEWAKAWTSQASLQTADESSPAT